MLDQIDLGSIALPEFQRGYVWNRIASAVMLEDVERTAVRFDLTIFCDTAPRCYSACKRCSWSTRQNVGTFTIGMLWLSPTLSKSSSALTT